MTPPSTWQIILILAIVLLLFGAKKIPDLAKGLGTGIKNFKKAVNEDDVEVIDAEVNEKKSTRNVKKIAKTSKPKTTSRSTKTTKKTKA